MEYTYDAQSLKTVSNYNDWSPLWDSSRPWRSSRTELEAAIVQPLTLSHSCLVTRIANTSVSHSALGVADCKAVSRLTEKEPREFVTVVLERSIPKRTALSKRAWLLAELNEWVKEFARELSSNEAALLEMP